MEEKRPEPRNELREAVRKRGRELRALPFEEIAKRAWPEQVFAIQGRRAWINVWVQLQGNDRARVVIQGNLQQRVLRAEELDGFEVNALNQVRDMSDEELEKWG